MTPDITAEELKERMDNHESLWIIDVREPAEFAEYAITDINIPLGMLPQRLWDFDDDKKDAELIVYCRSGMRSGSAKMILMQAGFTRVRNLIGGMLEWQSKYTQ
ncbi:MAG: rhodanese-like domain-containing protein [Chitinophagales bacterium]